MTAYAAKLTTKLGRFGIVSPSLAVMLRVGIANGLSDVRGVVLHQDCSAKVIRLTQGPHYAWREVAEPTFFR
jgi:hypothetical protein